KSLTETNPALPDELHDRAADNWRLPIAIADCISSEIGTKGRQAAEDIVKENLIEESNAVLALADANEVFTNKRKDWIPSADLITDVSVLEGRTWKEWNRGTGLTQNALARLLKPFHIHPYNKRIEGQRPARGYDRKPIEEAAKLYCEKIEKSEPEPF